VSVLSAYKLAPERAGRLSTNRTTFFKNLAFLSAARGGVLALSNLNKFLATLYLFFYLFCYVENSGRENPAGGQSR
jgi:hypothetical protein